MENKMKKYLFIISIPFLFYACSTNLTTDKEHKAIAEKYINGLYGCNPSVVDELAADSIVITYPIFEKIFGSPVIRGRDSVKSFSNHFCSTWKDAQFTFHETIAEGNQVVIVWSFKARNVGSIQGRAPTNQEHSWGGITLFRFNEEGKITAEIGEESEPGPIGRLNNQQN